MGRDEAAGRYIALVERLCPNWREELPALEVQGPESETKTGEEDASKSQVTQTTSAFARLLHTVLLCFVVIATIVPLSLSLALSHESFVSY